MILVKFSEFLRANYAFHSCVNRRPGKSDEDWSPTILGLSKRELVKDVLGMFGTRDQMI